MIEREEGWLYGGFQGKMGWFPESYVEKQHKSETPSKAALNLQAVLSTSRYSVYIYYILYIIHELNKKQYYKYYNM